MQTNSFRGVIAAWSTKADFARDMDVPYPRAFRWGLRNNIPTKYWPRLIAEAGRLGVTLTADDLMNFTKQQ